MLHLLYGLDMIIPVSGTRAGKNGEREKKQKKKNDNKTITKTN